MNSQQSSYTIDDVNEPSKKSASIPEATGEILVRYRGADIERAERQVLKDVDFTLHKGEFCYLVGRVGSGKSSLMKTMYADVPIKKAAEATVLGLSLIHI